MRPSLKVTLSGTYIRHMRCLRTAASLQAGDYARRRRAYGQQQLLLLLLLEASPENTSCDYVIQSVNRVPLAPTDMERLSVFS